MIKVGINGFGRIGRNVFKILLKNYPDDLEIAAINDLTTPETLAYLLKYDSVFGRYDKEVESTEDSIIVDGKEIKIFAEKEIKNIPWSSVGADIIIESTGLFTQAEKAREHLKHDGVKKVLISAPAKGEDITIVLGVNEDKYIPNEHNIISNASCTTNCIAPFVKLINQEFGIVKGLMTTVHSYTNDQKVLDQPHKDLRRGRAVAESVIPTTTGAAKAVSLVLPELEGKLNGFSLRVPTPTVSCADLVVELKKPASVERVNALFKNASETTMKGILGYSEEPLVSSDYIGDERSSIIDALSTMSIGGNMIKVLSWYDNEWGYSSRLADLAKYVSDRF